MKYIVRLRFCGKLLTTGAKLMVRLSMFKPGEALRDPGT